MAEKRLLTVQEAADRLGISRAVLYPRVMRGDIASVLIGRRSRRIATEDLEQYIAELRAQRPAVKLR